MKKLKLNNLADAKLNEKELCEIIGGEETSVPCCTCGCNYSSTGGSSSADNGSANKSSGLRSSNDDAYRMWCPNSGGWVWVTR